MTIKYFRTRRKSTNTLLQQPTLNISGNSKRPHRDLETVEKALLAILSVRCWGRRDPDGLGFDFCM
jgi:hypothetical protein